MRGVDISTLMNISQLECTLNASFMRNDDCNLDDVRLAHDKRILQFTNIRYTTCIGSSGINGIYLVDAGNKFVLDDRAITLPVFSVFNGTPTNSSNLDEWSDP